ncbi:methyltransferase [Psychroserpens sp.]|jgi:hypothetical protein|uniref:methyltransferase n=1 Tax=Psychroserpens sp. TaxID=2020870 RepID=UPI0039E420FB
MITIEDINKPKPIKVDDQLKTFEKGDNVGATIESLRQGEFILIKTFYSDGISLLADVHKHLKLKLPNDSFKEQQAYRAAYQELSNLVVVEIVDQKLSPKKSPNIGWLNKFYPDNDHFLLTFPQVQGLNSAWQWHEKGIALPVLRNKLQPYYGAYFPTRFEHLILFDNFLKHYKGPKKTAIDVGVGCGVLSLQMVNSQFQKVFATDINPNAIFGLQESMGTTKLSRKIELDCAHLFGKFTKQTELIVFNPPWLPETRELEGIDEAIYYNNNLFDDFFMEAQKRLLPEGQLVIIFSNLAKITNVTTEHPVEKELVNGKRFQLERYFKKQVKAASNKTKRDQHWRDVEEVELWVLKHI